MVRVRAIMAGLLALGVLAAAARADEVVLTSGERLEGTVIQRTAEVIVLEHRILGRLTIELKDISTINGREPGPAPETRDPTAPLPPPPAPPAPDGLEPPAPPVVPEWKSAFELGLSASEGATEDASVRVTLRTQRKIPTHLLKLDSTYRLATRRGDRTENRFTAGLFSEWREQDSRWTAFGQSRYDMDEFQSWDDRITLSGGFGYDLLAVTDLDEAGKPIDRFVLTARGGGGIRREWGSQDDDLNPEGLLGAEFVYQLNEQQRLNGATTYFPDLGTSGEYRLVSNLDWTVAIDRLNGINLKLGLAHEYESQTDPDIPHNDFSAYATLVVNF